VHVVSVNRALTENGVKAGGGTKLSLRLTGVTVGLLLGSASATALKNTIGSGNKEGVSAGALSGRKPHICHSLQRVRIGFTQYHRILQDIEIIV